MYITKRVDLAGTRGRVASQLAVFAILPSLLPNFSTGCGCRNAWYMSESVEHASMYVCMYIVCEHLTGPSKGCDANFCFQGP